MRYILFLLCFIMSITVVNVVMAQDEQPIKPAIESMMKEANVTFDHNSVLNFTVQIPQNYRVVPKDRLRALDMGERFYGEIFEAYGPAVELGVRPYFMVKSIGTERIISPEKWLNIQMLNKGHTLKDLDVVSENEVKANYIRLDDAGYAEIVGTRVFHHQNRLVVAESVTPTRLWNELKDIQQASLQSFTFQGPYEMNATEKVATFKIEGLNIEYPQSWRFKLNETDAINRQEFVIEAIDRDQFIFANVSGALIANKSLRDRLDRTYYLVNLKDELMMERQRIEDLGFKIEDPIEAHLYDNKFETNFSIVEVYPMRRALQSAYVIEEQNAISHELWLVAIRTPKDIGKNYIFTMIAPSRDQNYNQWAYAVDGLEYIVESLR